MKIPLSNNKFLSIFNKTNRKRNNKNSSNNLLNTMPKVCKSNKSNRLFHYSFLYSGTSFMGVPNSPS